MNKCIDGTMADYYLVDLVKQICEDGYDDKSNSTYDIPVKAINNVSIVYDIHKRLPITTILPMDINYIMKTVLSYFNNYYFIEQGNFIRVGNFSYKFNIDMKESYLLSLENILPCVNINFNLRYNNGSTFIDMVALKRESDIIINAFDSQLECAIILNIIARHFGYKPGKLTWVVSKLYAHTDSKGMITLNSIIRRDPINCSPYIRFNPEKRSINELTIDDITIVGYPYEQIRKDINY